MAVDDAFRGKGLGTLLLERLALVAVRHGIQHFWAVTQADNQAMVDVFRESGFELREELAKGYLEVDLSILPSEQSVARTEMRDRVATAASLRPFFRPRAVAVIGASRDPTSIGGRLLNALLETRFNGPVYPVNPKAANVGGLRAYPSVRDLPGPVDLAVIAVPAAAVPAVVEDCAARGVRALVVISAGFAEVGAEGREQQRRLAEQVRGHGMRMIGPNCLGLMNTDPAVRLNASFSPIFPAAGRIAMSSQSGASGSGRPRGRSATGTGPVHLRQRRQQGRRLRQRPPAILGRRRKHRRHPALPGIVRQSPAVRADCAAGRPAQADCRGQERSVGGGAAGRRIAHGGAGGQRYGRRCLVSPDRRDSRRHAGRDVRPGGRLERVNRCRRAAASPSSPTRAAPASSAPTLARPAVWCCRNCRRPRGPSWRRSCPARPAWAIRWT